MPQMRLYILRYLLKDTKKLSFQRSFKQEKFFVSVGLWVLKECLSSCDFWQQMLVHLSAAFHLINTGFFVLELLKHSSVSLFGDPVCWIARKMAKN